MFCSKSSASWIALLCVAMAFAFVSSATGQTYFRTKDRVDRAGDYIGVNQDSEVVLLQVDQIRQRGSQVSFTGTVVAPGGVITVTGTVVSLRPTVAILFPYPFTPDQLEAPSGPGDSQGSYTLSGTDHISGEPIEYDINITETADGYVTQFCVDGRCYDWDPKDKVYRDYDFTPPNFRYYEFRKTGPGTYSFKAKVTTIGTTTVESGTATLN